MLLAGACGSERAADPIHPALASGNGVTVTAPQLAFELASTPTADPKVRRAALDRLVDRAVLVAEAKRRHLDQSPEVEKAVAQALIEALWRDEREQQKREPPAEEDLRAWYEAHKAQYTQPGAARFQLVFLAAAEGSPQRARRLADAKAMLAQLKAAPPARRQEAFAALAKARSEDPSSGPAGGDVGFKSKAMATAQYGADVAAKLFALAPVGAVELIAGEQGIYLAHLLAVQPERIPTFEELRAQGEHVLTQQRAGERHQALVAALREKAQVKIDEAALERLTLEPPSSPAAAR